MVQCKIYSYQTYAHTNITHYYSVLALVSPAVRGNLISCCTRIPCGKGGPPLPDGGSVCYVWWLRLVVVVLLLPRGGGSQ